MMQTPETVRPSNKVFFGWWILAAVCALCAVVQGFTSNALTVIFKPLAADLSISRAATSGAAAITRLEGGFEALLSGWLVDKFGPKWVMFAGIFTIGVGLVLMNFIQSLWAYYAVWGVTIATGNNLALTLPIDKTITDWFVKKRGLAMGVKFAFIGVGGVIIVPIATWLTVNYGWRFACLVWAVVTFASLLLVLVFVRQKRPEHYGLLPDGARRNQRRDSADVVGTGVQYASEVQETEFSLKQAMRTRSFWLIMGATATAGMVQYAINLHVFPFLTDSGIDETAAGFMMGLMIFFTIPSRLVAGIVADRVRKGQLVYLLAASFLVTSAGILALVVLPGAGMIYLFLILFGVGTAATTPLAILMRARYFGRKAYGSIAGVSSLIGSPLGVISPIYAGWVYDTSGSYTTAFAVLAALPILSALMIYFARPPVSEDNRETVSIPT